MMRYCSLLVMLALAGCSAPVDRQPDAQPMHLILLAGQSNMAGRGEIALEDQEPHPQVWMLDRAGEWVPAVAPLHSDRPDIAGVGLGRSFAIAYAEDHPGVRVGLIPAAEGGSPIESWTPGGVHGRRRARPYDAAIERTRAAKQSGQLVAILWHQGESDDSEERAPLYEGRLRDLIQRIRTDLDEEGVPFLIGQLGQFRVDPLPGWHVVDAAHQAVASDDPWVTFVSSDGLTHKGDSLHFDAPSLRTFGRRYYEVYQQVTERADD